MGIVSRIQMRDFRNLETVEAEPVPGINLITGANGQGKTSLLEGIYYLAFLRSFRTRRPVEMILWDQPAFRLEADIVPNTSEIKALDKHTLAVSYSDTRELLRDGKFISAATDFINSFLCVALVPEDLALIKGTPLFRRRFLDMLLCQMSREYLDSLVKYNRALAQRNALLKNPRYFGENAIRGFDHVLAVTGAQLIWLRANTVESLGKLFTDLYAELTDQACAATVTYHSSIFRRQLEHASVADLEQGIRSCLETEYGRDIERRTTRLGPHRDDLSIYLHGKSMGTFASEGQCRLGALALRLSSMQLLTDISGDNSVVLLIDDVFGELDDARRTRFFKAASQADQVIVTCTSVPAELADSACRFTMSKGIITGGNL